MSEVEVLDCQAITESIESLLAVEGDQNIRMVLVILERMSNTYTVNTLLVRELKADFEAHLIGFREQVAKEEKILNFGRGAWYVLASVLVAVQAFALYSWQDIGSKFRVIEVAHQLTEIENARLTERVSAAERDILTIAKK